MGLAVQVRRSEGGGVAPSLGQLRSLRRTTEQIPQFKQ